MNNEGIASPALRRSQLAAAMSKREIPATEAPHEPCNDLGPTCASYLTRPCSRDDRYTKLGEEITNLSSRGFMLLCTCTRLDALTSPHPMIDNHLHPNISLYILHNFLFTFPIVLTIKRFSSW